MIHIPFSKQIINTETKTKLCMWSLKVIFDSTIRLEEWALMSLRTTKQKKQGLRCLRRWIVSILSKTDQLYLILGMVTMSDTDDDDDDGRIKVN
jgi:hypothetical protein